MTDIPRRLEPPEWYGPDRRAIWEETVRRLTAGGQVFKADPRVLDAYVAAAAAHTQASRLLAQTSVLITRDGKAVENPALAVQRRTAADLAAASKALGLGASPMTQVLAESPMAARRGRWCEDHKRHECVHSRQDGADCHANPVKGLESCKNHGGKPLAVLKADGQAALAAMFATPAEVDPGSALLEEVRWSAGYLRDLRARVAELAAAPGPDGRPGSALWWNVAEETHRDGAVEQKWRAGPHVLLAQHDRAADRLVRAAMAAHTAGAQDAALDVAKAVGASITRLLDEVYEALELQDWQRALIPERMPGVLRRWNPEEEEEAQ